MYQVYLNILGEVVILSPTDTLDRLPLGSEWHLQGRFKTLHDAQVRSDYLRQGAYALTF